MILIRRHRRTNFIETTPCGFEEMSAHMGKHEWQEWFNLGVRRLGQSPSGEWYQYILHTMYVDSKTDRTIHYSVIAS